MSKPGLGVDLVRSVDHVGSDVGHCGVLVVDCVRDSLDRRDWFGGGGPMARDALPTGTVTFLLTDIEGSTALWERDPGGMAIAVE